jgi:hypothetical protein
MSMHLRLRRLVLDALLLPVALVVVVLEDVVWAGALALLRALAGLVPIEGLRRALARLPAWAALPLFLVPELGGRAGELWAAVLLARGDVTGAVAVYVLVRLLATLLAVFIYHACEKVLLGLPWFARLVAWVRLARDWAVARVYPLRQRLYGLLRRGEGAASVRFRAIRRRLRRR